MTAGLLAREATTPPRLALTLMLLTAPLGSCDPVDETPAEQRLVPDREREARRARSETERLAPSTGSDDVRSPQDVPIVAPVAADVAAGLVDAGPLPPLVAAPAPVDEPNVALGGDEGYVRPVIHSAVTASVRILRFALAEDVVNREPVRVSSSFRHDSGPIHVFLEVRNDTGEDVQLSVGFRPAARQQRSAGVWLTIPPQVRYRTRARSNTRRAVGEWLCEVMDEQRRVLATQRFFITPGAEPSTADAANP